MGLLRLLTSDPLAFVLIAAALIMSLTVHEYAHALVADRLGDSTPRRFGRLTLNPLAHLDPLGTILLLVVGFGFAKPVPINGSALGRWGSLWVAAAGPISNLLLAVVLTLLSKVVPNLTFGSASFTLDDIFNLVIGLNVLLAVFNLIPIPLFDGSRIVAALFPRTLGRSLAEFERLPYSSLIVLGFVLLFGSRIAALAGQVADWMQTLL